MRRSTRQTMRWCKSADKADALKWADESRGEPALVARTPTRSVHVGRAGGDPAADGFPRRSRRCDTKIALSRACQLELHEEVRRREHTAIVLPPGRHYQWYNQQTDMLDTAQTTYGRQVSDFDSKKQPTLPIPPGPHAALNPRSSAHKARTKKKKKKKKLRNAMQTVRDALTPNPSPVDADVMQIGPSKQLPLGSIFKSRRLPCLDGQPVDDVRRARQVDTGHAREPWPRLDQTYEGQLPV